MSDGENKNFGQNLIDIAGGYYLGKEASDAARAAGQESYDLLSNVAAETRDISRFQPFTVATTTGTGMTTPSGGISMSLSPEQAAMQSQLFSGASSLFGRATADPLQAQENIYNQMRALQRPEEERERLALEERMLSQGRLGLQSAAYGGSSPELTALANAQEKAKLEANLMARGQALKELEQFRTMGSSMFTDAYKPQQELLDALDVGRNIATIPANLSSAFMSLFSKLGQSGVEALMQGEKLAQAYELSAAGGMLGNLSDMFSSSGSGSSGSSSTKDFDDMNDWEKALTILEYKDELEELGLFTQPDYGEGYVTVTEVEQ